MSGMSKRALLALLLGALLATAALGDSETDALGEDVNDGDDDDSSADGDATGGGAPGTPGGMGDYGDDYGGDDYGGGGGGGGGPVPGDPIKGFVELDDFTYDKVIDGSRNVFVYAYTSWDEVSTGAREALVTVGADLGEQTNLLLVKVDIDENTALKERFGITDEDETPGRMLLAKKVATAADVKYEKVTVEGDVTAEAVTEEIAAVAGGAGTVPELAPVVASFVDKPSDAAIKTAQGVVDALPAHEKPSGAYYVKVMTKSLAKGADYPKTEASRLVRMIEGGALRSEKVKEFRYRINALRVFDPSIPKPPAPPKAEDDDDVEETSEDADADADADASADDKSEL